MILDYVMLCYAIRDAETGRARPERARRGSELKAGPSTVIILLLIMITMIMFSSITIT